MYCAECRKKAPEQVYITILKELKKQDTPDIEEPIYEEVKDLAPLPIPTDSPQGCSQQGSSSNQQGSSSNQPGSSSNQPGSSSSQPGRRQQGTEHVDDSPFTDHYAYGASPQGIYVQSGDYSDSYIEMNHESNRPDSTDEDLYVPTDSELHGNTDEEVYGNTDEEVYYFCPYTISSSPQATGNQAEGNNRHMNKTESLPNLRRLKAHLPLIYGARMVSYTNLSQCSLPCLSPIQDSEDEPSFQDPIALPGATAHVRTGRHLDQTQAQGKANQIWLGKESSVDEDINCNITCRLDENQSTEITCTDTYILTRV